MNICTQKYIYRSRLQGFGKINIQCSDWKIVTIVSLLSMRFNWNVRRKNEKQK